MQPTELLAVLSKLKPVKELTSMRTKSLETCNLTRKPEVCSTTEAVQAQVNKFAPKQGWLCFQDEVKYFRKEPVAVSDTRILLYGEVANDKGQSLHINENSSGGWIVTLYTEKTAGDKSDEYLVENISFLGEKKFAPQQLCYRVYWQYDKEHGYRKFASRFNGFA